VPYLVDKRLLPKKYLKMKHRKANKVRLYMWNLIGMAWSFHPEKIK
jgi:hypothetical protein